MVNYRLNLHTIRSDNDKEITHLHSTSEFHSRNRVFFSTKDILLWHRININAKVSAAEEEDPAYLYYDDLDMNACVKQYIMASLRLLASRPETK